MTMYVYCVFLWQTIQMTVFCAVFYISQFVLSSVSIWPRYCLSFVSFPLAMIVSVFCQIPFISWTKGSWQTTDNIMAKGKVTKDRQYHGQRESDKRQTLSWPKGNWQKTDNIMAKWKLMKVQTVILDCLS
jgi:hypothetical protein